MKEFHVEDGGRYTYADDIINLQDLALAFSSIFDGCDSFIISGCNVEGSNISAGYVYLNGRIRRFNGAKNCTWPQYIYEENNIEYTPYASGTSKPGRYTYGCAIGSSVPDSSILVNGRPASIEITQSGNTTIKDALFGKYAMIKESLVGHQTISDAITFNKTVKSNNSIIATGQTATVNGSTSCKIFATGDKVEIISIAGGRQYALGFWGDKRGVQFYVDGVLVYQITDNGFVANSIEATNLKAGNVSVSGSNIFNSVGQNNTACVDINMIGYDGAKNYNRDLRIGDGKGTAIITITGSDKSVVVGGQLRIQTPEATGIVLKSPVIQSSNSLVKNIIWSDINNVNIASIGYYSNANKIFKLSNSIGDIEIQGFQAVNIGPAIKEDGTLLSDKYAIKTNGLAQFISDDYPKSAACFAIGAQPQLQDSGWKLCTCGNCITSEIVARQIGKVVYVTGWIKSSQETDRSKWPYFLIDTDSVSRPSTPASPTDSTLTFPIEHDSSVIYDIADDIWRLYCPLFASGTRTFSINFTYIAT